MSTPSEYRNALPENYTLHWYCIESVLGRGGFGITYLARDTNLNQPVAIKEFLPTDLGFRASDETIQPLSNQHAETYQWGLGRFLTEARTLAKFKHPNIVLIHSVFEANNTAYIVMEYETGASLAEAYNRGDVSTEEDFTTLLLSLMDGVECMHAQGFVHRDIKPSNIYMRENNHPILIDFGSARQALGIETRTLTTLVSPGYAPFEQYNATSEHDDQGPWTDVYALGSTIFRGIASKDPSDALTLANKRIQGIPEELEPATIAGAGRFSKHFLKCIDIALRFNPDDRPQSIAIWRDYLLGKVPIPTDLKSNNVQTAETAATMIATPDMARFNAAAGGNTAQSVMTGQASASPEKPTGETNINTADQTLPVSDGSTAPAATKNRSPFFLLVGALCVAGVAATLLLLRTGDKDQPPAATTTQTATTAKAANPDTSNVNKTNDSQPVISQPETVTPKLSAAEKLAMLKQAAQVDCGLITLAQTGDSFDLSGYTTTTESATAEVALAGLIDENPLSTSQVVFPDDYCATINVFAPLAMQAEPTVNLNTVDADGKLTAGDRLVLKINTGAFDVNYLYVDYFALDGNVLHMLTSNSEQDNRGPANSHILLGEEGGIERWDIAPPFGTELITVLNTNKPLTAVARPEAEAAADYLENLQENLAKLTSEGGQVNAALLKIVTSE